MDIKPYNLGCERGELHCIKKIASFLVLGRDPLDTVNEMHLE
jgi:hypothetical protein